MFVAFLAEAYLIYNLRNFYRLCSMIFSKDDVYHELRTLQPRLYVDSFTILQYYYKVSYYGCTIRMCLNSGLDRSYEITLYSWFCFLTRSLISALRSSSLRDVSYKLAKLVNLDYRLREQGGNFRIKFSFIRFMTLTVLYQKFCRFNNRLAMIFNE